MLTRKTDCYNFQHLQVSINLFRFNTINCNKCAILANVLIGTFKCLSLINFDAFNHYEHDINSFNENVVVALVVMIFLLSNRY